jgi:hypothetical protein
MTDLRDRLRDADPVQSEPSLPPDAVATMRRTVLEAVPAPRATAARWKGTLAIAAAVVLIAGAGFDTYRRASRVDAGIESAVAPADAAAGKRTQLHFSTPGGTRIIWTLDPAFQLKENR